VNVLFTYVGEELGVFAHARNWKAYVAARLAPHVRGRVLEVGAGLGATTAALCGLPHTRWTALEPDAALLAAVEARLAAGALPASVAPRRGTTADLAGLERFDTILYIDVLEHIEDDRAELARATALLAPGGRIVVLSPAFQTLYSPFDAAIGHFRRYTRRTLAAVAPPGLAAEASFYLDVAGAGLSLANRLLLRQAQPTAAQIATWDRYVIPLSLVLDRVAGRFAGRSVVAVWRRPPDDPAG
jgi:SAM-dependent methyltransferase